MNLKNIYNIVIFNLISKNACSEVIIIIKFHISEYILLGQYAYPPPSALNGQKLKMIDIITTLYNA